MNTRENILKYLEKKDFASGMELAQLLGISRQAVNRHIKTLIQAGDIVKEGVTRGAMYRLAEKAGKEKPVRRFKKTYALQGLEEDRVLQELAIFLNLEKELSTQALGITRYAFTEMLNNAIEHSLSERCSVEAVLDAYGCYFRLRDFGIGLFYSIFKKLDLPDENAGIGELIKGKTTTMPERHAGEGIFFTSKAGDQLALRSHKIRLLFDNTKEDIFVQEKRFLRGTDVYFKIGRRSKRRLDAIFQAYAPEAFDYRFDRTRVKVKLFQEQYVSRSEARRVVHGLGKFVEIILDFDGVKSIGQGFADEIFRVFQTDHPHIRILTENVSSTVGAMISHVVDNKIS